MTTCFHQLYPTLSKRLRILLGDAMVHRMSSIHSLHESALRRPTGRRSHLYPIRAGYQYCSNTQQLQALRYIAAQ